MVRPRQLTAKPTTLKTGRTSNIGLALALNARQVKQSADVKQAFEGAWIKAGLSERLGLRLGPRSHHGCVSFLDDSQLP